MSTMQWFQSSRSTLNSFRLLAGDNKPVDFLFFFYFLALTVISLLIKAENNVLQPEVCSIVIGDSTAEQIVRFSEKHFQQLGIILLLTSFCLAAQTHPIS